MAKIRITEQPNSLFMLIIKLLLAIIYYSEYQARSAGVLVNR